MSTVIPPRPLFVPRRGLTVVMAPEVPAAGSSRDARRRSLPPRCSTRSKRSLPTRRSTRHTPGGWRHARSTIRAHSGSTSTPRTPSCCLRARRGYAGQACANSRRVTLRTTSTAPAQSERLLERYAPAVDSAVPRGNGCVCCPATGGTSSGLKSEWWNEWEWAELEDHLAEMNHVPRATCHRPRATVTDVGSSVAGARNLLLVAGGVQID